MAWHAVDGEQRGGVLGDARAAVIEGHGDGSLGQFAGAQARRQLADGQRLGAPISAITAACSANTARVDAERLRTALDGVVGDDQSHAAARSFASSIASK